MALLQVRAGNPPTAANHADPLPPHREAPLPADRAVASSGRPGSRTSRRPTPPSPSWRSSARPNRSVRGSPRPGPCSTGPASGRGPSSTPRTPTSSCASGPATWPCGASPTSSTSPYDPDPAAGRSHQRVPAGVGRRHGRDGGGRRPAAGRPRSRRGRRGGAGGSTTTRCCSTWPGWWRRPRPRGSPTAARSGQRPACPSASGDPPRRRKTSTRVRAMATTMASSTRAMP